MLAEILLSTILWTGIDPATNAELEVSCQKITVDYGGLPTSNKVKVTFGKYDPQFSYLWHYSIPMKVDPAGKILLEPVEYWLEEIKTQDELILEIDRKVYRFKLKGSYKALKCD